MIVIALEVVVLVGERRAARESRSFVASSMQAKQAAVNSTEHSHAAVSLRPGLVRSLYVLCGAALLYSEHFGSD